MTRRGLEIRVGIVVVLAIVVLVVGVMWFQQFKVVQQRSEFFVRFPEVGGLKAEDQVFVDGVVYGRVLAVQLAHKGVVVRLGVRKSLELPVDSEVKLQSSGVMGERYVDIIRGKSTTVIAPGDTINGEFMMGLSELMGDAGKVMVEVARTTRDLDEILKTLSQNGRLQSSIRDLSEASSDLRSITAENRPKLTKAIAGIEQVSVRLDSLISSHYAALDSSLAGFGRAGQGVDQMVQNLSDASEDLNEIMQKLRGGQGTLGKLLSDDELFDRLNSTVSALDSLITDIKLHPGRYVKLELF